MEGEESSAPLVGAGGMLIAADGTCTHKPTLTLLQVGAGGEHTPEAPVIVLYLARHVVHTQRGEVLRYRCTDWVHTHQERSRLQQQEGS